jgi:co-chaperonin GroES (HSP10)
MRYDWFPIEPFEDVVFVEQAEEPRSAGGLILAGDYAKLPAGRVVAVGPGRWFYSYMDATGTKQHATFVPTRTQVGDYVVFGKYQSGGEPLTIAGKKYLMCREGDLGGKTVDGQPIEVRKVIET